MAQRYDLQPTEVVLIKDESVAHDGGGVGPLNSLAAGFTSGHTNELILTNLNLVLLRKGKFGNSKGVIRFPIDQIKVYNQQAQAVIGKARNGGDTLQVYFLNGQEEFRFQSGGKKKINEWIVKINSVVTGQERPMQQTASGMAIPGTERVAGVLKDTLGVFKSRFAPTSDAPASVAGKCRACGAPVTGYQGQTITCQYCDSAQQL